MRLSCPILQARIEYRAVSTFDGSWSHRGNARETVVALISEAVERFSVRGQQRFTLPGLGENESSSLDGSFDAIPRTGGEIPAKTKLINCSEPL
jgi:hypothetical protein